MPTKKDKPVEHSHGGRRLAIVACVLLWTFFYNMLIKGQGLSEAFFRILDTISDDFVMGTLLTVLVGTGIVLVFSVTKLYTQIIANIYSFRIIEDLVHEDLKHGRIRDFCTKIINFQDQPLPYHCCPASVSIMMLSFGIMYVMSWVYLVLFSEALFFVSWSAGVDLPITDQNLLLLPTLALAIPFSARVMAYVRYPYAQDYADFMPGAVFVLLVVATLGYLFQSEDQKFFLVQVFSDHGWMYPDRGYLIAFLRNGVFLAFIPVFFEAGFWMIELAREEAELERLRDKQMALSEEAPGLQLHWHDEKKPADNPAIASSDTEAEPTDGPPSDAVDDSDGEEVKESNSSDRADK